MKFPPYVKYILWLVGVSLAFWLVSHGLVELRIAGY
jgi:hypothetical protein